MSINPMLLADFYKLAHRVQYPENTELIYSTWTPRVSRLKDVNSVVAFGFQAFIKKYILDYFYDNFFNQPRSYMLDNYKKVISNTLGEEYADVEHISNLYSLGYLPIRIKAVPEGTVVPIGVPILTIENTLPEFFWITNYLETLMSCELWQATTSATIARQYKKLLMEYAEETGDTEAVKFQGHDFSMRGMSSVESAQYSGAGHLLSFVGTDSIPAILHLEEYYNTDVRRELIGTSIPASEHSVMCAYGQDEYESYRRLITEVYPSGFVSIVSDTWDLWNVLHNVIATLKPEIMNRDGRVVIRPDSGDPVDIICGTSTGKTKDERKGVVEILWDIFGGTVNEKGYKVLDSHIGCIYGDAITLDRAEMICLRLKEKGFASTNVVFGIGSYTYQYNTRDTFGFALKSTYGVFGGKEKFLFKDPVTDTAKFKKSATGKVVVVRMLNGKIAYIDKMTDSMSKEFDNILRDVFVDGRLVVDESLQDIRERLEENEEF